MIKVLSSNFEKLTLLAERRANALTKRTGSVAVKIRHLKTDWRGEGYDEEVCERMQERCELEHGRIKKLSGSKHWIGLAADMAAETRGHVGGVAYPCIFLEHFAGKDLSEVISSNGVGAPIEPRGVSEDDDEEEGTYAKGASAGDKVRRGVLYGVGLLRSPLTAGLEVRAIGDS